MSYNPYTSSTPPRPFRIMFGFMLAVFCLLGGMGFVSHEFHKALIMQGEPTEMDWETLVQDGFGDNPHVCLLNVAIVDPYEDMDDLFGGDDLDEMMDDPMLRYHLQSTDVGPAKVIPIGANEQDVPRTVLIADAMIYLDEGFRQVDEYGAITGVVSTYGAQEMVCDFVSFCTGETIEAEEEEVVYTIVPIDGTPDLDIARWSFLLTGFGLSLGLIMCGSGGPGAWTMWYAPIPSVLSLIGYPMRYGRGGWTTRLAYIGVGAVLMGYGYYMLIPMGNFGATNGNPIFHAVGFAAMFIGLGGVLAVPMQITMRALDASVESQPKKKPVRMSWNQACSMEPVVSEIEYEDQELAPAGTLPLNGDLKEKADALEEAGFTIAKSLLWHREAGLAAAAVQLGCQHMVVSDLEYNNDSDIIETGLISVIGTGLPIITVSANSGVKQNRPSANCMFQRSSSSDPSEMLSEHLETVVSEAEDRDTIVVEFDESESHDVVQLARRALAEIQGMIDGQIVNVGPKRYGRFHFPPAPVPDFVPKATPAT